MMVYKDKKDTVYKDNSEFKLCVRSTFCPDINIYLFWFGFGRKPQKGAWTGSGSMRFYHRNILVSAKYYGTQKKKLSLNVTPQIPCSIESSGHYDTFFN